MARKVIDNWIALAEYDLSTAQAMLQARRYLYVGFMCQQAVEKILKACFVQHHGSTPPYTHNLLRLVGDLPWEQQVSALHQETFEMLNSYYIESRYTEDIAELQASLTEKKAVELLNRTKELMEWIKTRL